MKCAVIIIVAEKPGQAVVQAVEVVVAVIKINPKKNRQGNKSGHQSNNIRIKQDDKSRSTGLTYLTAAALVLPGLMLSAPCAAEDDEMSFQQSHYEESKRNLYNVPNNVKPIQVDSIEAGARTSLTDRLKFSFKYTEDTWSGATPIYTAPLTFGANNGIGPANALTGASPYALRANVIVDKNNNYSPIALSGTKNISLLDADGNPYDQSLNSYQTNKQLVHIISVASPETRKQGDFKLGYEWDRAALKVGGGTSVEKDYKSDYGNLGGYIDFNQKLTRLNLGLNFTNSETSAQLDPDLMMGPYTKTEAYSSQIKNIKQNQTTVHLLQGKRQDWSSNLGLTQVLTENALLEATLGYTRSNGYMSNPYKSVGALFVDPNQNPGDLIVNPTGNGVDYTLDGNPTNILTGTMLTFLEKRPTLRNQFNVGTKFVQYIKPLDAALHFDYHFSSDDWGINSHAFESDWVQPIGYGWTITPRIRYYSQEAADFYKPYLLVLSAPGSQSTAYQKLPGYYSSDQRLSGFGTLSGGVSLSKKFAKGVTLETGFEYYTHAGSLKLGGGGEGDYANFDYYVASAGLTVNLSALGHGGSSGEHSHHHDHQHGAPIPAGVMFGHMMEKTGDLMVGYRYMYSTQAGSMLNGENSVADKSILNQGCSNKLNCYLTETGMNMHMHMLDLMYAPTDWLNLMLMPQFVDMNMSMKSLPGAATYPDEMGGMMPLDMANTGMSTGGIGDTGIYTLFKLISTPSNHINLTLGATAPTGDIGRQMRRTMKLDGGLYPYGMQLGSGTWDFKPSMTYTGKYGDWSWGAQVNGTKRLENKNNSGYALGDIFQSSAWGSYNLLSWLSTSVRGVYTAQGSIKGQYNGFIDKMSPSDYPQNYGGKYWDVGFGLNAFVPSGDLAGNNLSFEWLQPVATEVNGYQLDRNGALSATWGYAF
jgi:hypothetical protein